MAHEDNSTSLSNLGVWLSMLGRNSEMGVALHHVITCEPLKIPRGERESQLHPDKICL